MQQYEARHLQPRAQVASVTAESAADTWDPWSPLRSPSIGVLIQDSLDSPLYSTPLDLDMWLQSSPEAVSICVPPPPLSPPFPPFVFFWLGRILY